MKAALYHAFGVRPEITTVPDPAPPEGGVVVEVAATGVCRSDWHGWMGHDPDIRLPHVPGHELAGTVVALGAGIRNWRVGDRVTVPFVSGCGRCAECQAGHQQVCERQFQPGFTHWGSFAQYVALHQADQNLVALPDDLDFVTAASLGCRFATSFRAVVQQGRVRGGEWVAVHGCGGVGLSAILIAKALGAQVIAIDIGAEQLRLAAELGADLTLNSREVPDVPGAVRELTGGGAHVSLDALGHPDTCANSVLCLRTRGRHIQVGLLLGDQSRPAVPMDRVIARELEIYGSHGMAAHTYPEMLAMIGRGALRPERLLGQQVSLEQGVDMLVDMNRFGGRGVTVIDRF
ncbi:zinc-dependent alcohol dehydrogenase family protein [Deinococcus gobiensis]|uniref:Alcohol dehydrogenase GroES-like protein n=1 Tax=Deinococcus gobiensis (strain DSM 21396 / JCM 16679 / CGMCC 1.7299 / I-0) TaxID=745776 RepID=H8GRZ9_DEIGI|nr:zinc-dependent alcohol dehydrogenase family protein [Deinococcus gobiensis]AFD26390.1 Alcohol dehydrogenase GroES-like protein [Deinococcus gobiensis I-0]